MGTTKSSFFLLVSRKIDSLDSYSRNQLVLPNWNINVVLTIKRVMYKAVDKFLWKRLFTDVRFTRHERTKYEDDTVNRVTKY